MTMNQFVLFFLIVLLSFSCGKPVADFSFASEKTVAPAPIQFENQSKEAKTYQWDFGDGNTSTEASPKHVFKSSGYFSVKLKATKGGKTTLTEKKIMIEAPLECLVEIETDYGTMLVQLSNATPQHRDNFLKLAEQGYYDGTLFHRVIKGFMIQGG
ncbi:MAG: peptidylprolyl isomerase, partial [Bacteroidota bacterium]